jgi:two-component system sensor histidine kinase SenX3
VVHARVAPLGTDHVLILVDDRTEARRVEEVRRDFVANVSHELKTPIGALHLLAEAVHDAADDPDAVRHFAERMERESRRLTSLVQEIIDLSRLQVADALHSPEPVGLDEVVSEAVDRCRLVAQAKHIDVVIGGDAGAIVYGDHSLLVTAVRNLVDNAIAYSPEHTRVGIGVRRDQGVAEVAVRDQGIGISLADQSRIFERFYRVDPARSRATGGTGLGLSIVKHVVANHGGEVTVWSMPGQGSTFTLRLPDSARSDGVAAGSDGVAAGSDGVAAGSDGVAAGSDGVAAGSDGVAARPAGPPSCAGRDQPVDAVAAGPRADTCLLPPEAGTLTGVTGPELSVPGRAALAAGPEPCQPANLTQLAGAIRHWPTEPRGAVP